MAISLRQTYGKNKDNRVASIKNFAALTVFAILALAMCSPRANAQATQVPPAEVCFQATTGISGMVGTLGAITGGSGGTAATYANVPLTGGSGSGATANITVTGVTVTAVVLVNPGTLYAVGDTLSALAANIGNVTGFSVPVASVSINSSLAGGSVGMYIPGTLTTSPTWQNAAETILNTNPIALDSNGCAIIYGVGTYRQILYDNLGNEVWDQPTSVAPVNPYPAGLATGTANAIVVNDCAFAGTDGQSIQFYAAFTNTGPVTINPCGFGPISIVKNTASGPVALSGGEIVAGNSITLTYNAALAEFFLPNFPIANAPIPVQGRLTLVSATPVQTATAAGATSIIWTPFGGNAVPVWNGSFFIPKSFVEVSQALTDATLSPSAAADSTNYDMFVWVNPATGNIVVSRGQAWTSQTSRGSPAAVVAIQGVLVNQNSITNGPGAEIGVLVGTIATNAAGTVDWIFPTTDTAGSFNVWNAYNQVLVSAAYQSSTSTWTYATNTYRQAHADTKAQITFVDGLGWNPSQATYSAVAAITGAATSVCDVGVGIDSTTAVTGLQGQDSFVLAASTSLGVAATGSFVGYELGFHTVSANEKAAAGTCIFDGAGNSQLTVNLQM
jgi:hypothetical protein